MSRAGYADFFPAAPSVLAEKEKKKAQAEKQDRRARNVPDDYDRESNAISVSDLGGIASSSCAPISVGAPLPSGHLVTTSTLTPTTTSSSPPPPLLSPSAGTATKGDNPPPKLAAQPTSTREPYPLPPIPIPPPPAPLTPKGTPPAIKSDPSRRNWKVKYDPFLEKKGVPKKSKEPILRWDGEGITTPVTDPRLEIERYTHGPKDGKKRLRSQGLYRTRWKWDENYIGPGPPSQILITGLSPLTTETEISMHFRPHGDIQTLEIQIDPATGGSLGVCSIIYRDSPRSRSSAHGAAKKAAQEVNGSRVGIQRVRVELDRDGLKCKKLTGRIIEEKRRKEVEAEKNRLKQPPPKLSYGESGSRPRSPSVRGNSPSGKDSRTDSKSDDRTRDQHPTPAQRPDNYRALDHVGRLPYIFITSRCIPGDERYVRHLNGRLKNFGLKEVLWDRTGFYVVFRERRDMERCFKVCDGDRLFSYSMIMEKHSGSHRSPSPPLVARPEPRKMGPNELVAEATNALMKDMKLVLMKDLRKRLAAPTIYDSLEVGRLNKRRKVEEEELQGSTVGSRQALAVSSETSIRSPTALLPALALKSAEKLTSVVAKSALPKPTALPRFKKRILAKAEDSSTPEASPLLHGSRTKLSKADARPLAHRLNRYDSDAGSDDESTITENRPVSRGSRALSLDTGDDDSVSVAPSANEGYRKRKRSVGPTSKLRDTAVSTDDEDQGLEKDDGSQGLHDLKKPRIDHPEPYEDGEVFMVDDPDEEPVPTTPHAPSTTTQPKSAMKHKSRAIESDSEDYEDGMVFKVRADSKNEHHEVINVLDDEDDNESLEIGTTSRATRSRESRQKLKAAETRINRDLLTVPSFDVGEEEHDSDMAGMDVEVSWGVSTTEGPMVTVQDDPDAILDTDGLQNLVKDAEDFKFLNHALAGAEPADLGNVQTWAYKEKQLKVAQNQSIVRSQEKIEGFYRPNPTGCARTEGYRRIPEAEKSMYLPHRLQLAAKVKSAASTTQEATAATATNTTKNPSSTSRMNRVNNRRLVVGLNNQKQMLSSDADVMRFNQLKKRKKPVKFARSAIHNWGLYAMENISAGDMIIEYVGEIIRQQVADMREKKYLKSGIGSSYLFRIDDTTVIDATKAGGIARFINHSCTPNCTAKIIKVEGSKRIVIYALRDIRENEELTYDYKFERELESEERIPCLCGSSGCKGFLN
ncbi:histone H3-K4 methyltransferase Set1 [Choiromyces venosus 120613-1]|uniref:Histone-lysine N-methyltransferase, H3 lysine-4 specific n=1 Tax=Choiromyces venosus 120613-1 TaxID=1336337 RepID=A0A3N4JBG8_9PEZI|nr:histone H3-K4 methyltransferase Set1 [Choiromyces venosus 120613-1]